MCSVFSQLKYLFGLHPESSEAWAVLHALIAHGHFDAATAIGFLALLILGFTRTGLASLLGKLGMPSKPAAFVGRRS